MQTIDARYYCDACGKEVAQSQSLFSPKELAPRIATRVATEGWVRGAPRRDDRREETELQINLGYDNELSLCEECFRALIEAALPYMLWRTYHSHKEPGRPAPFRWTPKNRTLLPSPEEI